MIIMRLGSLLLMFNMAFAVSATTANAQVTPESPSVELSQSEQEYLSQKDAITFCIDPDWMPFEAIRSGKLDGMTSDFQHLFAQRLGTPFRFIATDSWKQSQDWAKAGTCDILPMVSITEERKTYLTFTAPYLSYSVGIISTIDLPFISGLDDLAEHPVGIGKGSSIWDYVEKEFPGNTFVPVDGIEDGLLKVSSGQIEAYLIAVPVATHNIKDMGLTNLKVAGHIEIKKQLRMGISRQSPQLSPIIQKLAHALTKSDIDGIYKKWVALRVDTQFDSAFLWKVAIVLLIVMTSIVLWLRKLRRLNKEITHSKKQAEQHLQESEQQYRILVETSPHGIQEIDTSGTIQFCNQAFCQMLGYSSEELINTCVSNMLPKEDRKKVMADIARLATEQPDPYPYFNRNVTKDGRIIDVEVNWNYKRNEAGEVVGFISVITDITERKQAETALKRSHDELEQRVEQRTVELQHAKEDAEKASLAKTKFLAAASHDLRQPLQAANLFLYALGTKEHQPESREIISNIEASVASLDNLLNGLLDISRLEAGLVRPQMQAFSIFKMMERLTKEYSHIAEDEGVEIKLVKTEAAVNTDPVLLESILRNLLSNAVKNTKHGKVLLGCRHHGGHITIEVWDNGRGIPENKLSNIFDEFVQVGNDGRDRSQGMGLGLSIVEKLAGLLNHQINVRSWEGNGSAFTVEIPLVLNGAVPVQHEGAATAELPANISVIVIDDEPDIRTGLSLALKQKGCEVRATSGHDCRVCKEIVSGMASPPDIIIADFRLQHGNTGIKAVDCFREMFKKDIPAILLTGDTAPNRLAEAKSSGLPILHKPVNVDDLMQEMAKNIKAGKPLPLNS